MASDENGEKTERPTDHRRQEAREQGNIARSADLNAAALLLGAAGAMWFSGPALVSNLSNVLKDSLEQPAWQTLDRGLAIEQGIKLLGSIAGGVLPLLLTLAGAALAANLAQVGFLITNEALTPKWNRLNPIEGFKRIFSLYGVARLVGSMLKLTILLSIVAWFVNSRVSTFLDLHEAGIGGGAVTLGRAMVLLAFLLAGGLIAVAVADYGFQYWKFEQDIRMTKQEIREEMRQMEGDPHIRQRRREIHRKLASSRQMQQVKTADVVVTNPTHLAVAIKYDPLKMEAPVVVAKGEGLIAERIRKLASEHGVPIIEKKPLARALYKSVKVGQIVPIEMYEAVAEILAYVYRIRKKVPKLAA